jgi:subtilisin family serine protease
MELQGNSKPEGPGEGVKAEGSTATVGARPPQFMIAPRNAPGLQPLSADVLVQQLKDSPDISIVKTIEPPRLLGLQSTEDLTMGSLVLARMSFDKAQLLQHQAAERIVVERDHPLTFILDPGPSEASLPNPGVLVPHADGFQVTFEIVGDNGPLSGAEVYVFGSVWPTQGVTDDTGRVMLNIVGESPDTIRALYIKPRLDYWSVWLDRPQLTPDAVNSVRVKPLGAYLHDFPGRQLVGWGERAMGLDKVPPSFDGSGVKVAVIDSGAAQPTHRNLHKVGPGVSIVGDDRAAWTTDTIGHGSHVAGIIGGGPVASVTGIRGFAPAAEVHVCRIFPGGRFSDLVSALDYCMENGIDVVNMSLGGGSPSRIIEERLIKAKEMGVACIVAAGNSGGPVQFPASTPHALAVAAMGMWGTFPDDSYHTQQVVEGFEGRDGYFPAKFSCFGPEIDVCAPGVAIVSSLPPDGFAAWDGTSMAAPHVTGLAALVLAHHPDFKGPYQTRNARRVERLFQLIKESATPLQFGDVARTGAGLPSIARALRLGESTVTGLSIDALPVSHVSIEALKQLLALLGKTNTQGASMQMQQAPATTAPSMKGPGRQRPSLEVWSTATVARGPAYINGEMSSLSLQALAGAANPSFGELLNTMRRAGIL